MRIVRGSLTEANRDRAVTRRLSELVELGGGPVLRAWTPPRQVAFGRRDVTEEGYDRACELAREHGYEPVERSVGGRAVAYTGSTLAFALAATEEPGRDGIRTRYRDAIDALERALRTLGVDVRRGEPEAAFCPGTHSLQAGGKIAGVAQRVRRDTAVVGGCVVVSTDDEGSIADVLAPVYDALDVPLDPSSVGSVAAAGGPEDPATVLRAVEDAFVGTRDREVLVARSLLE